jgi:hypothetical protein
MKLGADIVQALAERIAPLDTNETRQAYREGRFPRADKVKDLDMRYRWDLFYAARGSDIVSPNSGSIVSSNASDLVGVTSAHIDTALRRIVAPLGK